MRITRVETTSFEPDFHGGGYVMSFVRQTSLFHRLIRLTADDGTTGIGEFVRAPKYDLAEIVALEDAHLPSLEGMTLADLPALLSKWRSGGKLMQGFVFGVELGMLDLIGRKTGVPVSSLLGGPATADMPEYLSLSSEAPETMAGIVRTSGRSFGVIQAKLGAGDPDMDMARVRAVLEVMRPDQLLLADFNGALTREDAVRILPEIDDPRVLWEEPCDSYDDGAAVARAIAAPVMLDQCLTDLPTYARAILDGAAAALVIKSDSIGGLSVGRTVRDMCAAAGIRVRIDGWWAGQVAALGALHLAAGASQTSLLSTIDLTDPIDTEHALIIRPSPGRIGFVSGPGLGLDPVHHTDFG